MRGKKRVTSREKEKREVEESGRRRTRREMGIDWVQGGSAEGGESLGRLDDVRCDGEG